MSIIPRLATAESIPVALLYGQLSSAHLVELARTRGGRVISDTPDFVGLLSSEQQRFKLQAIAQSSNPPAVEKVKKEKVPNDNVTKQSKDKSPWVPRADFLARLEADRQRELTPVRPAKRRRPPSKRRDRSPAYRSKNRLSRRPPESNHLIARRRNASGREPNAIPVTPFIALGRVRFAPKIYGRSRFLQMRFSWRFCCGVAFEHIDHFSPNI